MSCFTSNEFLVINYHVKNIVIACYFFAAGFGNVPSLHNFCKAAVTLEEHMLSVDQEAGSSIENRHIAKVESKRKDKLKGSK